MRIIFNILKAAFFVCVFILPCSLFSQEHYFGVRGAYSISSISFDPYQGERESVSGIDFGIIYKLYAEKYMGTQIEVNYVQKGYKVDSLTYSGNAIELPIMAQGFVKFGGFRIFANAGVFGSYMICQDIEKIQPSGGTISAQYDFTDRDNRFEYGIMGGGGLGFQLSKFELQVEARYQYSLGYTMKPRYREEPVLFSNRSHLAFSAALLYNF